MSIFVDRGITHFDLHGIRHQDVEDEILNFVYQNQSSIPLIIICGNSNKMIEIVSNFLHGKSIEFSVKRFGVLRIESV